ncbi:MAG TPA: DUF4239 domain-containing protein [Magnetospirillum sp.]|nr:DUF4239 domain-containing protein [Magnetospirillum sp.]
MPLMLHTYDHYLLAAVALLGTLGACGVMLWLGHSRLAPTIRAFRGLSPPFVNVIGVLFALTLAFLANDTWNAHDRATNAVYQEAGALRSIQALTRHLPDQTRARVDEALQRYLRMTVEDEWPRLAHRQGSPETSEALAALLEVLSAADVAKGLQATSHAQVLEQAIHVRGAREQRMALSQTHVNPLKWLGMAFLGLVTMVSIAMVYVDQPKAELLAVMLFAAAAAPTAAIVLVQGNPYLEPSAVKPAPLAELVRR